ncbi:MAG: glycosyltransferase family 2 protein [Clostridia bacterium]|nr:glycosyltransferase family 2 protein [Clostridia bacterium]
MKDTAIIILTYNGIKNTIDCIESLKKQTYKNYDIVLVDNKSEDYTVEIVKARFRNVLVIENMENLGYAGGNNVGLSYCISMGYKYVFVINNDITLEPDALEKLIHFSESHNDVCVVGPVNHSFFNKEETQFLYSSLLMEKYEFRVYTDAENGRKEYETDYVNGAAMLIKTQVLKDIGLFDDNYFLFWEESDLCLRIRRHGYKCMVLTDSVIYHKESASFSDTNYSPLKNYYLQRNKLYFFKKNFSTSYNFRFYLYCLDRTVKMLVKCLLKKPASFYGLLKAFFYAYTDFMFKRMGNRNAIIQK